MTSLWQAIVIILVCSFLSLGVRPGAVVALAIPLTLAIVFAVMDIAHIDLHRISLGALIIALALLVDDAMTTVDAMIRRLGAGDSKDEAATFAYRTLAAPMLIGTLVTIASFVPDRLRPELRRRVHVLDLLRGRHRPPRVVAGRRPVRAAGRQGAAAGRRRATPRPKPSRIVGAYSAFLSGGDPRELDDDRPDRSRRSPRAIFLSRTYRGSSSRRPTGPSSPSDLTLRQNASIYATEAEAKRLGVDPEGRPRRRPLQHLRGPRCDPLHPDLRRPARRTRSSRSSSSSPRTSTGRERLQTEAGAGAGRAVPGRRRAGVAARTGAAGGLAAAVPDRWGPTRTRCASSRSSSRRSSASTRVRGTSTTTGWSRRGSCA